MAEVKISELPIATTISGTDIFPIVQGGITKRVSGTVAGFDLLNRTTLDSGKVLHLSADGLPEYPDSTAGTTYLQTEWSTVDGFALVSGGGGSVAVSGGKLVFTKAVANEYIRKSTMSYAAGLTVKGRVRIASGTPDNTNLVIIFSGASSVSRTIDITGGWTPFTCEATGTPDQLAFYVGSLVSENMYVLEIDFIYIGDGTYATKMPDVSGNGNDGTVIGCTPIDTIVGKAPSFDYTNDYILLDKTKAAFTGAFSFSAWVQGKARTAVQYIVSRNYSSGSRGFYTYLDANNRPVFAVTADGTTFATVTGDAGSECTADCMLGFKFVPSVGMYIYKNGALIKSNTTSIPASVYYATTQVMVIGIAYGLTLNPFDGWIGLPRLHNRALSDAEFWELYQKPRAAGAPVNAPSIRNLLGSNWTAPTAITTPGVKGQIAVDEGYLYVHTGVQWERVAIATW